MSFYSNASSQRALSKDNYLLSQIVKEQPIVLAHGSDFLKKKHQSTSLALERCCCCFLDPTCDAGGANRDRTGDLLLAKQALSQLSYGPRLVSIC